MQIIHWYSESHLFIKGYTTVDWASDPDDRKSNSNFAFLLYSGNILWKSKKQTWTTLLTMESEFMASVSALQKVVWTKRFFECLNIPKNSKGRMILYYDSQANISHT